MRRDARCRPRCRRRAGAGSGSRPGGRRRPGWGWRCWWSRRCRAPSRSRKGRASAPRSAVLASRRAYSTSTGPGRKPPATPRWARPLRSSARSRRAAVVFGSRVLLDDAVQRDEVVRSTRCSRICAARSIACVPASRATSTMMWHLEGRCQQHDRPRGPAHGRRRSAGMRHSDARVYASAMPGDRIELELAGHEVAITSPDKVYFAERGETKLDLVRYYRAVEEPLLRAIGGRPMLMERYPDGAERQVVLPEARAEERAGLAARRPWSRRRTAPTSDALVAADLAHMLWAVNQGCLGFHAWPCRGRRPEHADELRIDLDPQPGVDVRRWCARRRGRGQGAARRARPRRLPEDDGQARHPRVRPRCSRAATRTRCGGGRGLRPRAGAPPARPA